MQQPIRIELPFVMDRTTVNAYLFTDPEPVLIDTGDASPEGWEALVAGLAAHDLTPADLSKVLITHIHVDHFGQAARLAEMTDADFLVIDAGYRWLTNFRAVWTERLQYYRTTFLPGLGLPDPQREQIERYSAWVLDHYAGVPATRTIALRAGEQIELGGVGWKVMHLPGHASTQSCFYQVESGVFLASDMLLRRTPTPVIEPPQNGRPRVPALPQYVDSLRRVAELDVHTVYPGHGQPFNDAESVIKRQLARIAMRKLECLEHVRQGTHTVYELHECMYPPATFVNMAGLWMLVGYLDLLQEEGLVKMEVQDGLWWYQV